MKDKKTGFFRDIKPETKKTGKKGKKKSEPENTEGKKPSFFDGLKYS